MAFKIKNIVDGVGRMFASQEVNGVHYPIVISQDADGNSQIFDGTGALVTIDLAHHKVHAGYHFMFTDHVELGSSASKSYLIVTPNEDKFAHIWFDLVGSTITTFEFFEDTDRESSALASFGNNNRNSPILPSTWIYEDPSGGTTDGIRLHIHKGGSSTNQARSSISTGNDEEIILKKNTKYLLKITSGAASNLVNVKLEWYEVWR